MASLPVEVVYGLYLGALIGVVPFLVSWLLGFLFKYVTGVSIPGLGVVVLAVAIAGANGGLLALNDPTLTTSRSQIRLTVALGVVLMGALYAHAMGDRLGSTLPRRITLRRITERTFATDVVERVGRRGRVEVTVAGDVGDIEGYPPLPASLRATVAETAYEFPGDLPLAEIESRFAERLQTDHDLGEVAVTLDDRARATVDAAPPVGGLSRRVPAGSRAVSVRALVPAGLAAGDEVGVTVDETTHEGTVLGVGVETPGVAETAAADSDVDGEAADATVTEPPAPTKATAVGPGETRVTLGVDRTTATALLGGPVDRFVARSRGTRQEFELVSLLRQAGKRFRRVTVRTGGPLDGTTLGEATVRGSYEVAVLAVRGRGGGWTVAPRGTQRLAAGDVLVAVGAREALDRFAEAVA